MVWQQNGLCGIRPGDEEAGTVSMVVHLGCIPWAGARKRRRAEGATAARSVAAPQQGWRNRADIGDIKGRLNFRRQTGNWGAAAI